jgi:two-component system sensor kinase FixL
MGKPLRVLLVGDSEADAMLLLRVLEQGGYEVTCRRVDNFAVMEEALGGTEWDIVISDYAATGFSGAGVLALLREKGLDLPLIVVSDAQGEDTAVEAMRAGAQDYVRKKDLGRLIPAIERELAESEVRRGRRLAEAALKESEERFRWLVEQITDYEIYMIDPVGNIIAWNTGAERHTGYRAEEVIGRHHSIFFIEEDIRMRIPEIELEVAAKEGRFEDEGWRVRKDGRRFWADVVTTALRDREGKLRGFSKVIRDITERKKAAEKILESEQRHRIIAETAADAIITVDEESTIIFANAAVEKIFGYMPDELMGERITILMPERLRQAHLSAMQKYLRTGMKKVEWHAVELPGLHRDGHEVPLEISYGEFMREGKHFFIGVVRDITERKQAEKEKEYKHMLERFNLELETLVAERTTSLMALQLADRVRNPAAVIRWTCKKMLEKPGTSDALRESLIVISEEADKLETMVEDFQTVLKSRQSKFGYEDMNEIVSGVLAIIGKEAESKGIILTAALSELPLRINVQKDLLRIAVFNLVRNAIEATPEDGRIIVSTCEEGDKFVLAVSDTGPGIPAGAIDIIFDPFYSTKSHRFGMGLPMIKQIVSEHMGKIEVKSEAGQGTTFRLLFPRRWSEKGGE